MASGARFSDRQLRAGHRSEAIVNRVSVSGVDDVLINGDIKNFAVERQELVVVYPKRVDCHESRWSLPFERSTIAHLPYVHGWLPTRYGYLHAACPGV